MLLLYAICYLYLLTLTCASSVDYRTTYFEDISQLFQEYNAAL